MQTLSQPQARALVRKYAAERPDNLARAKYVHAEFANDYNGERLPLQPECIVGQIFVRDLGVLPNVLEGEYHAASEMLGKVLPDLNTTVGARQYLDSVQRFQDGRQTYEEAEAAGLVGLAMHSRKTWAEAIACADAAWKAGFRLSAAD